MFFIMTSITWLVCAVVNLRLIWAVYVLYNDKDNLVGRTVDIFFLLTKYNLVGLCPCFLCNYMYNLVGRTVVSI